VDVLIELESPDEALALFGSQDQHLRLLREHFAAVAFVARNGCIKLSGEGPQVAAADQILRDLLGLVRRKEPLSRATVEEKLARLNRGDGTPQNTTPSMSITGVRPRTNGQRRYLDRIDQNDIVFSIGPAGTGKTFLAVAKAVEALKRGRVMRLILSRPAVEAGEKLGFLPGDFQAKVNPYLRPLYDALNELLGTETVKKLLEQEVLEIVPLAYMRGRTLNHAFIILDEAQNTTVAQMKMFLTRMGERSRIVVTGDPTQTDLPPGKLSGLAHFQRIMPATRGIAFHVMTGKDIVRHPLVCKIVEAYEQADGGARVRAGDATRRPSASAQRPSSGSGL
jgi:phosphate starvation-inducible PhoH-like protein